MSGVAIDADASAAGLRLALFLPSLAGGGAERVTLNLARALVALGHDVDLLVATASGPYLSGLPEGVTLVDLRAVRTLRAFPALARYLRGEEPDGLLSAMNHANIVAAWAARIARFRGTLLLAEHNELPPRTRSVWQRAFNTAIRLSYPRADRVIAVSHGVKRSLVRNAGVPADRIDVIYNPVIGSSLAQGRSPRPAGLPSAGVPVFIGVGRLTEQKNFANLLSAFARLRAERDARLVILGEGPERASLEAAVDRRGLSDDVTMPGFVDDAYAYLAHADVFVLSSDWEGLPTVLIEALALGARIVATDCPSGPREILADGAYGALVPIRDSDALASAMAAALDDPPPRVPAEWLAQFTEATAARRYMEAFTHGTAPLYRADGADDRP